MATHPSTLLAVSFQGELGTAQLSTLFAAAEERGCVVVDARAGNFANTCSGSIVLRGAWNHLARFEAVLPALSEQLGLKFIHERTHLLEDQAELYPYEVEVVGPRVEQYVAAFLQFFNQAGCIVHDMNVHSYAADYTSAETVSLQLVVLMPTKLSPAHLREHFFELCDISPLK